VPRQFKVEELLNGREMEDLRVYAAEPGRSVDELLDWVLERGYTLGRSSVGRWKQSFDEELLKERFSRSGEMARNLVEVAKQGAVAVSDAALLQLTQVLFEQMAKLDGDGKIESAELVNLSRALKNAVGTKQGIEDLRQEMQQRQRQAVEEASKTAKAGGSGEAVVQKMRDILGIKEAA
jgi:hypothetical protein